MLVQYNIFRIYEWNDSIVQRSTDHGFNDQKVLCQIRTFFILDSTVVSFVL
jgi:hypothetical protein